MTWPYNAAAVIGALTLINVAIMFAGYRLRTVHERRQHDSQVLTERKFVADVERYMHEADL